jgi:hypothetical protein
MKGVLSFIKKPSEVIIAVSGIILFGSYYSFGRKNFHEDIE